jgi:hypothetical protein
MLNVQIFVEATNESPLREKGAIYFFSSFAKQGIMLSYRSTLVGV